MWHPGLDPETEKGHYRKDGKIQRQFGVNGKESRLASRF